MERNMRDTRLQDNSGLQMKRRKVVKNKDLMRK